MRGFIDLMFPSLKRLMFRVCDTHDVASFFLNRWVCEEVECGWGGLLLVLFFVRAVASGKLVNPMRWLMIGGGSDIGEFGGISMLHTLGRP